MPVHVKELGLLSASNIVTLCANHHREMHYGIVDTAIEEHHFKFKLSGIEIVIPRTKIKLRVGVLAYGSLMDDPGEELRAVTIATFRDIETPMAVEYARSSIGRAGAPTLVPVENGGCKVRAWIYELSVDEKTASDILYRREIDKVGSGKEYAPPEPENTKRVAIDRFLGLGGLHIVLSTRMAATITPLNPERLAKLAIESARTVWDGRDGISYLLNATKNGIATPLSDKYSSEILRILGASNLNEAIDLARGT